jgi:polygalacturonase
VAGCIKARNANHIKIWGGGIIDGSFSRNFMDSCASVYNKGSVREPVPGGIDGLISISESSDVTIEGITLFNSKTWDVVPSLCNNVNINNIKIISDNNSDDGIDIVSTRNISVMNSFIRTKDDCIAIKSFAKPQPLSGHKSPERVFGQLEDGPFYPVDSVSVQNCVFWNAAWGNALEIGFELSGNISNVIFTNNDIIRVEGGAAFSIHNARRGVVSKILVDGLRVENTDQKLFDLAIFRSVYSEDGTGDSREVSRLYLNGIWDNVLSVTEKEKETHSKFRGHINGVTLKNVSVVDGPLPFSVFYGSDKTHLVENVTIEGLTFYGKNIKDFSGAKLYLENTKNIIIK